MAHTLTQEIFNGFKKTGDLVIVDFWATWCPPCKTMSPIFEHLSQDVELNHISFYSCDVDAEPEIMELFKISSIPTFLVLQFSPNGEIEILFKHVGVRDGLSFKQDILKAVPKP
jgi:thioredoxin